MTPNVVELKESQCFNATHGRMGKPVPISFNLIEKPVIHLGCFFLFVFFATVVQVGMLSDVSFLLC